MTQYTLTLDYFGMMALINGNSSAANSFIATAFVKQMSVFKIETDAGKVPESYVLEQEPIALLELWKHVDAKYISKGIVLDGIGYIRAWAVVNKHRLNNSVFDRLVTFFGASEFIDKNQNNK